jgi:hypothetical protein
MTLDLITQGVHVVYRDVRDVYNYYSDTCSGHVILGIVTFTYF